MMKLLIVSHTEHYIDKNGCVVGLPSTLREIDQLATLFDEVIHIACLYSGEAPTGMAKYKASNVRFESIPPFGGTGFQKLTVVLSAPIVIWKILHFLKRVDVFHFRAPTSMGVYVIPILSLFKGKMGWYKYAGNWIDTNPPQSYRWQRFFLKRLQSRFVTINGSYPSQPSHILSFENPCLHEYELVERQIRLGTKEFKPPYTLCFIGRLDKYKGLDILLEGVKSYKREVFKKLFVIGQGEYKELADEAAKTFDVSIEVKGSLERDEIFKLLDESHFLFLPSKSEGLPKVIAEAWASACIPVVSSVSSIPQYVKESLNGFLIPLGQLDAEGISEALEKVTSSDEDQLQCMTDNGWNTAKKFTFERYLQRIQKEIILMAK